jgi:D-alanyl-D-alanine carboxypeptidase (penicillin-binding protein 5/6)
MALALVSALALGATPSLAVAAAPKPPSVSVPSAGLYTIDGLPLWTRKPQTERRVASTIKMLNALVVRERADLDDVVVISKKAASVEGSGAGLRAGQRLTVRQLLNLMLIASANDAAEALAIHVSGSEKKHVARMNAKARQLGLTHTHAVDPHGLSKREHSTARDLAALARVVLADPELRAIVKKRSVKVPRPSGATVTLRSTYNSLSGYPGIEGVKTGFTNPAGYCFVGAAKRNGVEIVGVVLGAQSNWHRFSQMRALLDWGFAHTHVRKLVSAETTAAVTPEGPDPQPPIVVRAAKSVSRPLLDGTRIARVVLTPEPVRLPVVAGQRVAVMSLRVSGSELATVALLALTDVSLPASSTVTTPAAAGTH